MTTSSPVQPSEEPTFRLRKPEGNPLADLVWLVRRLGPDERRLLCRIAERLRADRSVYGKLDLATDRRDFRAEAAEELLDATIYLTAELERRERLRP